MKRLAMVVLALLAAACDNHPCWPNGPPPELFCPESRPYVNAYHPGECFAAPLDTAGWIPKTEVAP